MKSITVGPLALQGDFQAHLQILRSLDVQTRLVRSPSDLDQLDGIVFPGGESTVMSRLSERYNLFEPLRLSLAKGLPAFGTCAGLIFLAKHIEGASSNFAQTTLGALDCTVARNAYGAQRESFQTEVDVPLLNARIPATFIRAPRILEVGAGVEVLARLDGEPIIIRQGKIVACAFHPEIEGDSRLHQLWLNGIQGRQT